jgi:hypothetical protein
MAGSYSIDPAVFTDTDGSSYMYFGGIWGGQLQRWVDGKYANESKTDGKNEEEPAISCKVVKLKGNMTEFDGAVKDVLILDSLGKPLLTKDHNRRFLKDRGCINSTINIISAIQPAIRTCCAMRYWR